MQVFVNTLTGKTLDIPCSGDDTIATLKKSIQSKEGISPAQQKLIFGGKELEDGKTLKDYDIKEQSTIQLVLKLRL